MLHQKKYLKIKKNKGRPLIIKMLNQSEDVENIYLNRKKIYALADYRLDCASKK